MASPTAVSDAQEVDAQRLQCATARVVRYVEAATFPCVGARSAFNRRRARFGLYSTLGANDDIPRLCEDLGRFSDEFPDPGVDPVTYVAMFDEPAGSESQFTERMWRHLQAIHEHDAERFAWDPAVSNDPTSSDFSFSVGGRSFFIVGLHPEASRIARQAPLPCLVFNFHDQFEALRSTGRYTKLQTATRNRDVALQGSINPVLARFGDASEARQYSGQPVADEWKCPFRAMSAERGR